MARWSWPASTIVRVVDGDTIDVVVTRDLGFGGRATFPIRLRLNRIDAPPLSIPRGGAARARVVELLDTPPGTIDLVTVKPYKYGGPEDEDGEYMAEVTLPGGRNLSDVLLAEGLALPYDGHGPRPAHSVL